MLLGVFKLWFGTPVSSRLQRFRHHHEVLVADVSEPMFLSLHLICVTDLDDAEKVSRAISTYEASTPVSITNPADAEVR